MAFSQTGDRSWVRLATLVTFVTVAAVVVRFGLNPHTVTYLGMPDFSPSVGRTSPPDARPCPP